MPLPTQCDHLFFQKYYNFLQMLFWKYEGGSILDFSIASNFYWILLLFCSCNDSSTSNESVLFNYSLLHSLLSFWRLLYYNSFIYLMFWPENILFSFFTLLLFCKNYRSKRTSDLLLDGLYKGLFLPLVELLLFGLLNFKDELKLMMFSISSFKFTLK